MTVFVPGVLELSRAFLDPAIGTEEKRLLLEFDSSQPYPSRHYFGTSRKWKSFCDFQLQRLTRRLALQIKIRQNGKKLECLYNFKTLKNNKIRQNVKKLAAVSYSPTGPGLGGAGFVFWLTGKLGRAWVVHGIGAWHGA